MGTAALAAAAVAWWRMRRRTYLRFPTKFGQARIYQVEDDDGSPVRLLDVGGIVQSGTYVDERYADLVFEYLKRYDIAFLTGRPIQRICVLGCGGYDYPEHLIAHHDHVIVDAVEIDPAITDLAHRFFFLDRIIEEYRTEETDRLNLICRDALAHLQVEGPDYDVIVNDTFDAGTPPAHLTGKTFAQAAHDRLSDGGVFLTNIVSALEGPGSSFLHEQVDMLGAVFKHVYVFPCDPDNLTEPDNVIVAATDEPFPSEILKQHARNAA